jgi:S-(hydroxymethyl)glutathione dehydrogenase/alcohol dehydrogenase
MKAVVVTGPQEYGVEEIELLPPQANEIRVKMKACGVCLSDYHLIAGVLPTPLPCVIGHEGAGVIAAVGAEVTNLAVGDSVVLNFSPACGRCTMCQRGLGLFCSSFSIENQFAGVQSDGSRRHQRPDGTPIGALMALGCMAEETVIHEDCAVKADPSIDLTRACVVSCGVMTGAGAAINTGNVHPGESVAVFGCGGVGLNAIQGARIAGANTIIAVDLSDFKLELAQKLGATHVINGSEANAVDQIKALTGGLGADLALECVGIPALINQAYDCTRPLGRTVVIGLAPPDKEVSLNAFNLLQTGKTICGHKASGAAHSGQFISSLLNHYQCGKLDLDTLVSRTYSIDEVKQSIEDLLNNANARGVIVFE